MSPSDDLVDHTPAILIHLEKYLGKMSSGYIMKRESSPTPFQIAKFSNQPCQNCTTSATLGLSKVCLKQPSGYPIRQELMYCGYNAHLSSGNVAELLGMVAIDILTSKKALLRGEVLGPYGPLFQRHDKTALYVTYPVYFAKELHTFSGSSPETHFVWLIPITSVEANFVATCGWSSFEDCLTTQNPDLLDIERVSLQL